MSDFSNFNSTFFLSLGTMLISGLGIIAAYAFKSKCSRVKLFCGCIDIVRDTELEADIEEAQPNNSNNNPIDVNSISVHESPNILQPSKPTIRRNSYRNNTSLKEIIDAVMVTSKGKEIIESLSNKSQHDIESKENSI